MDPSPRGSIRVGSRRLPLTPGRPLLSELFRGGWPILQRSIRYHRPRAPFCGVGQCTQCLVRVNGVPNVRACEYVPTDGDRVATENAWPSADFDLLGALDRLFPHGLDTLHGFRRPAAATPLYHRVVRRLAGYGRIADAVGPTAFPPGRRAEADVVVVGFGSSGSAAARALAERGVRVLALDRRGIVAPPPGVETLGGTTAVFLPPPRASERRPWRLYAVQDRRQGWEVAARAVVVATGAYDANLWFAGSDRPGVVTAEGALVFAASARIVPFRRAILFGGEARAGDVLDRCGAAVEAVVAPGPVAPELAEKAAALEIPLYPRTMIVGARGRRRVRGARLRSRADGSEFDLEGDGIILAHRRVPLPQLFFQAGAEMEWRGGGAAYYPKLRAGAATSRSGLFAVGEGAGFVGTQAAEASGEAAARQYLGEAMPEVLPLERVDLATSHEIEGYYRQLLTGPRPRGKWVACPCEDVLLGEIEEAHRRGYRGIEVVKRYTGVGTGLCQGRYCLPDTLVLLARLEERTAPEVGYITQRPPVLPMPLGAFAGLPDEAAPEGTGP